MHLQVFSVPYLIPSSSVILSHLNRDRYQQPSSSSFSPTISHTSRSHPTPTITTHQPLPKPPASHPCPIPLHPSLAQFSSTHVCGHNTKAATAQTPAAKICQSPTTNQPPNQKNFTNSLTWYKSFWLVMRYLEDFLSWTSWRTVTRETWAL